ncbi:MAG: ABC transporter ATP-binding protein [Lachnospiraceae bacterium]
MEPHIELTHITKRFGDFTALNDVSLVIPQGKFVTLLGPSGCGKTTLLRVLAGFYQQDAGTVRIAGKDVGQLPPEKRGTPLVFQDYALFPHMTVAENIEYGLKLEKTKRTEINQQVEHMLEIFSLEGLKKRYPRELSGGQQQRVAFARALIMDKGILLLDEPLSNLDAKLRIEVRAQLRKIQKQQGMTVVYVTHDQEEAMAMSDIVAVMYKGEIQQLASPEEVYCRPASHFVAQFIGSANLLPAKKDEIKDKVLLSGVTAAADSETFDSQAVLRPEHITLCIPGAGDAYGIVEERVFLGRLVQYSIRVNETLLFAEEFNVGGGHPVGEKIGIRIDYDKLHLIEQAQGQEIVS